MKALVILLAACFLDLSLARNLEDIKEKDAENITLIFSAKNGQIGKINFSGEFQKLVTDKTTLYYERDVNIGPIDFDFDYGNNSVIWMTWDEKFYSNNQSVDEFLFWNAFKYLDISAKKIAVDFLNQKIYAIDTYDGTTIEVLDFYGEHKSIIYNFKPINKTKSYGIDRYVGDRCHELSTKGMLFVQEFPHEIVLDPYNGTIFVLTTEKINKTSRIYKISMDGKSSAVIVQDSGKVTKDCTKMDVDRDTKRLYWINCEKDMIESVDYYGNDRTTVLKNEKIVALAVYNDFLFWSSNTTDVAKRSRIRTCRIVDKQCEVKVIRDIHLADMYDAIPHKIKAVTPTPNKSFTNPCAIENGGCEHLCLLSPSNNFTEKSINHTCICNVGWRLVDSKSCKPILKYLLFERNNFILGKDAADEAVNETNYVFPPKFVEVILDKSEELATIDYDPETFKFFYGDCSNFVFEDWYDTYNSAVKRCYDTTGYCYKSFNYDAKRRTMVYLDKWLNNSGDYFVIGKTDLAQPVNRTLLVAEYSNFIRGEVPLSLAYDAETDYLYLLSFNKTLNKSLLYKIRGRTVKFHRKIDDSVVAKMESNPLGERMVIELGANNLTGITLYKEESRLYWFASDGMIGYVNLDDDKVIKSITKSPVENVNAMTVDSKYIYVKNLTCIWRINKYNHNMSAFVPEEKDTLLRSNIKLIERPIETVAFGKGHSSTAVACESFCQFSEALGPSNLLFKSHDAHVYCKCKSMFSM